ncbi:MAG: hypothetical protein AAB388_03570 [Patescibacteria group bacterium]
MAVLPPKEKYPSSNDFKANLSDYIQKVRYGSLSEVVIAYKRKPSFKLVGCQTAREKVPRPPVRQKNLPISEFKREFNDCLKCLLEGDVDAFVLTHRGEDAARLVRYEKKSE